MIVSNKIQDGQLSQAPITLSDIDAISDAFATVLNGVFHERIEYPDPPMKQAVPTENTSKEKPDPASTVPESTQKATHDTIKPTVAPEPEDTKEQ
jgi:hypothetical protein